VAGLGITASGTQAAERVRTGVEKATGVALADLDPVAAVAPLVAPVPAPSAAPAPVASVMPVAAVAPSQAIGAAPPAPPAPPAPAAAPAPPAWRDGSDGVTVTSDGKVTGSRVIRVVRRDRNDNRNANFRAVPAFPEMPEISSRNCPGDGKRQETVIHEKKGDKRIIVICTNRIEKLAHDGAVLAMQSRDIQREAYRSALDGLRSAQARMRANRAMGEQARDEAIRAIDGAIDDMEVRMTKGD